MKAIFVLGLLSALYNTYISSPFVEAVVDDADVRSEAWLSPEIMIV